jgi:hypothetical protein
MGGLLALQRLTELAPGVVLVIRGFRLGHGCTPRDEGVDVAVW